MLYEQKGLIQPQKDQYGYRVYQDKDIERLIQIKCLRQLDFSISQIKDILFHHRRLYHPDRSFPDGQTGLCPVRNKLNGGGGA